MHHQRSQCLHWSRKKPSNLSKLVGKELLVGHALAEIAHQDVPHIKTLLYFEALLKQTVVVQLQYHTRVAPSSNSNNVKLFYFVPSKETNKTKQAPFKQTIPRNKHNYLSFVGTASSLGFDLSSTVFLQSCVQTMKQTLFVSDFNNTFSSEILNNNSLLGQAFLIIKYSTSFLIVRCILMRI